MHDTNYKIDEEILNKIIAAAYKDAGLIDRLKIYFLSKKESEVKRIYNEYRNTAKGVKNIPLDECPASLIEFPEIKTKNEKKLFVFKPAYVLAVSLIVVSTIVAVLLFQNKEKEAVHSKAEIELAEKQVKESLALVNRVFRKTENLIQEDILPKRVGKPVHKSLSIINEVLTGG